MDELHNLREHPHYAAAGAALEPFGGCVQGRPIGARACDDGSIELRAIGHDWRATVYLDDSPGDSGWVLVRRVDDGAPVLEEGSLDDWGRLAGLLAAASV